MNFRPHRLRAGRIPKLPLVALIDVVLFLLMYFMLATDFSGASATLASTLKAESRPGGAASTSTSLVSQVLGVEPASQSAPGTAATGWVYVLGDRRIQGRDELVQVLKALPKESGLVIKVAPSVPVAAAAAAIQSAKDAGFTKVSYVPSRS